MNSKELSIDELLKQSMREGNITSEELDNIHRIIGYDQQHFSHLSSSATRQTTTTTSSSSTASIEANDIQALKEGASKLGYTQAWEKLSIRLENLESLTNIVPFHSVEQNPYLQLMSGVSGDNTQQTATTTAAATATAAVSAEDMLSISQELFRRGDIQSAILASEANVQTNQEYSEGVCVCL